VLDVNPEREAVDFRGAASGESVECHSVDVPRGERPDQLRGGLVSRGKCGGFPV
jgi:hypothetical protein